ncbi:MAG: hypothetical protein V3T70_10600, partial [Phycisphaerae bacterium]
YRRYFRAAPDRRLASWMAQAMAAAYRRKPEPTMSDFLFELADWLVAQQIRPGAGNPPELIGGVVDQDGSPPNAETARCLAALCDAHWMADRLGDAMRARRYAEAVRSGARFVMQLQFREPECYYMGGLRDVVGGVRHSLWDHRLGVDDSAAALWALARARDVLFGTR